ncbi:MAG: hypothetical protein ACFE8E_02365 [Candidatus Hodarchaeota archaeon]
MVDKHSQSFFGQSTGLTVISSAKTDPYIFFKCVQKKPDGNWEKPSSGEGKTIKCSLDEIIMILQVLKRKEKSWSGFHSFKDAKTQISFKWDDKVNNKLKITIGKYSKILNFSQIELLRLLLKHILKEKIKYATTSTIFEKKEKVGIRVKTNKDSPIISSKTERDKSYSSDSASQIEGSIKNVTEKALFIDFDGKKEIWIPKSTIKSNYNSEDTTNQLFLIDDWILKKNNLLNN